MVPVRPRRAPAEASPVQGTSTDTAVSDEDLDKMTKAELLDQAAKNGVEADESMTKAEIRDAIDAG